MSARTMSPPASLALALALVFIVALGYGVALPVLPFVKEATHGG